MSANEFLKWRGIPIFQDRDNEKSKKEAQKLEIKQNIEKEIPLQNEPILQIPHLEVVKKEPIKVEEDVEIIKKKLIDPFYERQYLFPLSKEDNVKNGLPSYKEIENVFGMRYEDFLVMIGISKGENGSIRYIVASFEEKKHKFPLQPHRFSKEGLASQEEIKYRFGIEVSDFLTIVFDETINRDEKISRLQYFQSKNPKYTNNNQSNIIKTIEDNNTIKIELYINRTSLEELIKKTVESTMENLKDKFYNKIIV